MHVVHAGRPWQVWQSNIPVEHQPRYSGTVVDCKYASILGHYNKWYIVDLCIMPTLPSTSTELEPVDPIEEVQESILNDMSEVFAESIEISNYGAFQTHDTTTSGYYIVQWTSTPYVLDEPYICHEYSPPQVIPEGTYVCRASFLNPMGPSSFWYHEPPTTLPVMVKMKQVIHANLTFQEITPIHRLPQRFVGYKNMNPRHLIESQHDTMLQEISRREILEYTEDAYNVEEISDDESTILSSDTDGSL